MTPTRPTDSRSDEALVAAANAGDAAAFEALYRRYRDRVVRLAFRFTGDRDAALDVMQDTFAYWLNKFPGFRLTARVTTFLYPVVRNTALAARRARRRYDSDDSALETLSAPSTPDDPSRAELAAVMSSLPQAQREVVLMRFVDGMSVAEVSCALGIPPGTVKSRLHHALDTLRHDPHARNYFT